MQDGNIIRSQCHPSPIRGNVYFMQLLAYFMLVHVIKGIPNEFSFHTMYMYYETHCVFYILSLWWRDIKHTTHFTIHKMELKFIWDPLSTPISFQWHYQQVRASWRHLNHNLTKWFLPEIFSKYKFSSWKIDILGNYHVIKRIGNKFSFIQCFTKLNAYLIYPRKGSGIYKDTICLVKHPMKWKLISDPIYISDWP